MSSGPKTNGNPLDGLLTEAVAKLGERYPKPQAMPRPVLAHHMVPRGKRVPKPKN